MAAKAKLIQAQRPHLTQLWTRTLNGARLLFQDSDLPRGPKLSGDRHYRKAPITEAVIELRLAAPLDAAELTGLRDVLQRNYPHIQEHQEIAVQVDGLSGAPRAKAEARNRIYRLSTDSQQEIVMLQPASMVCSQLAPYSTWSAFFERFRRDWRIFQKEIGYRRIARLGLRYINRIDIPNGAGDTLTQSDYVQIGVHLPSSLSPTIGYAVQAVIQSPSRIGKAILNTSVFPFPFVPDHTSFSLDIDVGVDDEPPQKESDIFRALEIMREDKNTLFEMLITDKARELFK